MKSPVTDSIRAAARALTTTVRTGASTVSTLYRATEAAMRTAAAGLAQADTRTQILLKAAVVGAAVSVAAEVGTELRDATQPTGPPPPTTGLGPEVDELVAKSPTLSANVRNLLAQGWAIGYGTIDAGGITSRGEKKIVINPDGKGDPLLVAAELAHETGHATAGPDYVFSATEPHRGDDYWRWRDDNLYSAYRGESYAGLMTARVRREILDRGGADIGHIDDQTKAAFDGFAVGDLTESGAVNLLADHLRDHPGGYLDHYGKYLDKVWQQATGTPPGDAVTPGSIGNAPVQGTVPHDDRPITRNPLTGPSGDDQSSARIPGTFSTDRNFAPAPGSTS
ncbi:hypothetical protein [Nocardia veterana]|uniref:Uncharacterized protein n=1 Tax=Nocardia veterana TaxID=132249 RepID=A0A7X6RHB7_9NOCA|nr:hypothetical protein [Nocardia veterana]NKY85369.1 hypothetical protein [Nocardia veterana]